VHPHRPYRGKATVLCTPHPTSEVISIIGLPMKEEPQEKRKGKERKPEF
jgi:hypothetical protein